MFQRKQLLSPLPLFPCLGILALALLSSCGQNPDYGKSFKPKTASLAANTATSTQAVPLGPCKTLTVYGGSNPALAQDFSGSSACPGTANLALVRIRVSASISPSARVCLVPFNSASVFNATCLSINGQADVTLSSSQFTAVALVYENHLSSYMSYMSGQSNTFPPMADAVLR